jgi:hypothetical protein
MGELIAYRGHTIELTSRHVPDPDGWVARAEITWTEPESGLRGTRVADPQSTRFATKEQADQLALKIARAWVDQRG